MKIIFYLSVLFNVFCLIIAFLNFEYAYEWVMCFGMSLIVSVVLFDIIN